MRAAQDSSNTRSSNVQEPVRKGGKWRRWLAGIGSSALLLAGAAAYLWGFEQTGHSAPSHAPAPVKPSADRALDAIRRGVEFLRVHQEADGGFSKGLLDPKPALTALVVEALAKAPIEESQENFIMLRRAAQEIISKQRPNGSICTPGLGVNAYSTSISIMALKALSDPAHAGAIEKAKAYLLKIQRGVAEGDPASGGVGYDAGGRVDGSNTAMWVEALKAVGVEKGSKAFENAKLFFTRLQNNPETNDLPASGTELDTDGGFIYRPGESKPKDRISRSGKRIPRSYGLMSYAGLKSFLYLDVGKDDPRVRSAWRWVRNNYTLKENRNIGADGLFYYYLTMAKALAAYGQPLIHVGQGERHEWARELRDRLLALQKADGSWRNDRSARWMENDSVMVTAFAIRTLSICWKFMAEYPLDKRVKTPARAQRGGG